MNPINDALKLQQQEIKGSELFPVTHLANDTVFVTKDGLLGSTLKVQGVPFITEDNIKLNHLNQNLHFAYSTFDERFLHYVTIYRKKEEVSLDGNFTSEFSRQVDEKYQTRFKNKKKYSNNIYLTSLLKGDDSTKKAKGFALFNKGI